MPRCALQGLPVAQQTYLFKEPYIETMQPYILRSPKNRLGFSATGRVWVSGWGSRVDLGCLKGLGFRV